MATPQSPQAAKVPSRAPINPWKPSRYSYNLPDIKSMPPFVLQDTRKLKELSSWLGQDGHKWGTAICHAARTKNVQMLRWLIQTSQLEFKQMLEQAKLKLKEIDSMRGELESTIPEWLAVITALIAEIASIQAAVFNGRVRNRSPLPDDSFKFTEKIEWMMRQFDHIAGNYFWKDDFSLSSPHTGACIIWYYDIVSLYYPVLEGPAEEFRNWNKRLLFTNSRQKTPLDYLMSNEERIKWDECESLVRGLVGWINLTLAHSPDSSGKTALMYAAESGDLDVINVLLQFGELTLQETDPQWRAIVKSANIEATDYYRGKTALFFAATSLQVDVVKRLVEQGANIEATDYEGRTVLLDAVVAGDLENINLLLRSGANIHATDSQERSLLFYTVNAEVCLKLLQEGVEIERQDENGRTALFDAVEKGNLELVDLLLRSGANIHATDSQGRSLLFYAVNAEVCAKLLKEGVELKRRDNQEKTALFNAVARENLKLIDLLLKSGADINATDLHGKNVLFYTAESKWRDRRVVDLLLESGANVDATDSDGKPVLFYAVNFGCVDTIHQLLTAGIEVEGRKRKEPTTASSETMQYDRFELLNALLEANTSVRPDYLSYLVDNPKSVEYLKEFLLVGRLIRTEVSSTGTNTHLISYHRILAELLHHAIWRNAHSAVEFLLRIGVDLETRNKAGETALIAASWARNTVMVKDLISRGADMEAKDNLGETALHKAISNGNVQLVKWLVENGTNIDAKDSVGRRPSQQARSELAEWLTDYEKKSYSDLSLQYAVDIFRTVRENYTRIQSTFEKYQCLNIFCLAGFDYAPSWYNYYNELDDKGFFTGSRQILWLETSEPWEFTSVTELLNEMSDIIRPIPVVAFDSSSETVIAVNDSHWHLSAPNGSPPAFSSGVTRQPFTHTASPQPPVTYRTIAASLQQNERSRFAREERAPDSEGSETSRQSNQRPSSSIASKSPEVPPETVPQYIPKFIGILDLEDEVGLHQQIKVMFHVKIRTFASSATASTTASIYQPELGLPRTAGHLEKPFLRVTHFIMTSGIDDNHITDSRTQLNGQRPTIREHELKVSAARQQTKGITGSFGMNPAIASSYVSATSYTKDYTPLWGVVDFDQSEIDERSDTKEHFWHYVLQKNVDGPVKFLDEYVSAVQYSLSHPVDTIRLCFDTVLEVNNNKRRGKRDFKFCGAKQVIMKYRLSFRRYGEVLEFSGGGWTTILSHKIEALPTVAVWSQEHTDLDQATAKVGMEMEKKVRTIDATEITEMD